MITAREYQERRRRLAMQLPEGSLTLIPAAHECLRNGDAHYRFRQDSDFYYLTGFNEPDAVLLLTAGTFSESVLFNRSRDAEKEQWTGKRLGQDGACEQLLMDAAFAIDALDAELIRRLPAINTIFYPVGRYPVWDKRIMDLWISAQGASRHDPISPNTLCNVAPFLGEMRLFKSNAEIKLMREAARISIAAHERAMRMVGKVHFEYELEAEIVHELARDGCRSVAYDSIVAGGTNACVLHYTENNQPLRSGDLVLIDAAAEVQNYAADITRTFPINGTFSAEQKTIYSLVLAAQRAGMALVRPGCLWDDIQAIVVKTLTEGLCAAGIIKGSLETLITNRAYAPFYVHRSGHWLGLDVHDVGAYQEKGRSRALEPGMVFTIEPGLYLHDGIKGLDSRWHGIGVRIEDDVLVTATGYDNLTAALTVDVNEIEALIRGG